jgi:hypothetical protein
MSVSTVASASPSSGAAAPAGVELPIARATTRQGWIDLLLVAAGFATIVLSWPAIGPCLVAAFLIAFGLVMPALNASAVRRSRDHSLLHLVPIEMADCFRSLRTATELAGVGDQQETRDAADEMVIDVAAILGGRSAKGGSQRRFVDCRMQVMAHLEADLSERHEVWNAALAEVDALDAPQASGDADAGREVPKASDEDQPDNGCLVRVFVVVLMPFLLFWELCRGAVRGVVALVDGLALRGRTVLRFAWRAVRRAAAALRSVFRQWNLLRQRVILSFKTARHELAAVRARMHRQLRITRRRLRRLRTEQHE